MNNGKQSGRKIRSIQLKEKQPWTLGFYNELPKDKDGIIYVRQSSLAQMQKNIHSFEMQTDKFLEHFRKIGFTGNIEIVADDEALSGTLDIHKRRGLMRTLEKVENGKIGWIGAVAVNRLTRDPDLVTPTHIMKLCRTNGVWIITLRMQFNFDDEYCRRVFMIEAEEAARHLEWMKLVLGGAKTTASSNGYYDGRWIVPGYTVDRTDAQRKKYVIYEPHAEVVKWLFNRFLELDGNLSELCREVNRKPYLFPKFEDWVDKRDINKFSGKRSMIEEGEYQGYYKPTEGGIQGLLCNPVYIGWWLPIDGGVVENNHDAIIDDALFTYAHKRLSTYDLNGERQKPERITRNGQAKGILKNVLQTSEGSHIYAYHDVGRHRYRQVDKPGSLERIYNISVPTRLVDNIFLEKFFERIEALEKYDDWEDKIEQRLAAKQEGYQAQKKSIAGSINSAQEEWQRITNLLHDKEVGPTLTKRMKLAYTKQCADLEAKIERLEEELSALKVTEEDDDDEEITLYQIHSLLPDIKNHWDLIQEKTRMRFVKAVVRKVVLEQVSPSWCHLEIHWKDAIGNIVDGRHFFRKNSNEGHWTEQEESVLRELYPEKIDSVIMEALPNRSWNGILTRAEELGIRRKRGIRRTINSADPRSQLTLEDQEYQKKLGLSSIDMEQWTSLPALER